MIGFIDQTSSDFLKIWQAYMKNRSERPDGLNASDNQEKGKKFSNPNFANTNPIYSFQWSDQHLSSQIINSKNLFKGLCFNDQLVSFIFFYDLKGSIEIIYLETNPKEQRKGYMEILLKMLIKDWPFNEFWLDVHERNSAAQKLYLKYGFLQSGRRPDYYKDGGACLQFTFKPQVAIKS